MALYSQSAIERRGGRQRISPIPRKSNAALPGWPWSNGCCPAASPIRTAPPAARSKPCRRMENHIKELFVFVAEPQAPPDGNAAERSLRHLAVSRKGSGGARSAQARTPR